MSDLHELTAVEQLDALRAREISALDLTEHYLGRIEQHADLGAFVTVTADLAREEAARADAARARGEDDALLGLPLGIKDMHATAGVRTTLGSPALTDHVPAGDAWTVGLLRRAGAVLVGKTSTSELGATCFTHSAVNGEPAVTPYATDRYSSGSSGGAATAVAAGLLPVGHGSDGAGSIRTPASTCHLVGVKPSRGLVSPAPASSFLSAGTEGPLARTVADAALLLDVMAQPWSGDLYGWRTATPFSDEITSDPRPLVVATWTDTGIADTPAHPESVRSVHRAADVLRALGHDVREVPVPVVCGDVERAALVRMFASSLGAAVPLLVPADRREKLTPYTRWLVEEVPLTATDVLMVQQVLARYASGFLAALADVDVALTPTTNGPPVRVGHFHEDGVAGVADRMLAWSCYTPWVNLTGQPAVSLPSHLDADGMPHGVQLVGRPRHDAELMSLAAQLERAALWAAVHPSVWHQ